VVGLLAARVYELETPLSHEAVRRLRVGDVVYLSGLVFTARDAAHRRIVELLRAGGRLPFEARGLAVYHCGPVVRRRDEGWEVVAAGPTTSMRMEPLEADFIRLTGVRMVIGKGGMGEGTRRALMEHGAVYAVFTGGAAVLAAEAVERVEAVYWLEELGAPEAVWLLRVRRLGPLVVAMDSHGGDLYAERMAAVRRRLSELLASQWGG
jgi:fumarate hydratase subunit beta